MKIGEAYVELRANKATLAADFSAAESMTRAAVHRLSSYAKFAAVAAAGMFAKTALRESMAFEQQMANVSTMVDDTAKHMGHLTRGVRELSMEFGQGTETMARGLYDILSASVAAEHSIGVLRVAAQAAVAGLTSTAISADAITTILNSYQMRASEAGKVSDILFATVKRGKLTFEQLASSIGMVASTASIAGVPLEEVSAYMSTVTRAGVNAFQAVTSLQAVLLTFLNPSDSAAEAAKRLGIELSGAALRAEGLLAILAKLRGMTPEQVASIFENRRAIKGVAAVLKDLDGILRDHAGAQNAAGAAAEAFGKQADTTAHHINQLKEEGKAAARDLGDFGWRAFGAISRGFDSMASLARAKNLADFGNIGGRESAGEPASKASPLGGAPQTEAYYRVHKAILADYANDIAEVTRDIHHEMDMAERQALGAKLRWMEAARDAIKTNIGIYEAKQEAIEKGRAASEKAIAQQRTEFAAWSKWKDIIFQIDKFRLGGGVQGAVSGLLEQFVGKIDPREVARRAREEEQMREGAQRAIDEQMVTEQRLADMSGRAKINALRAAGKEEEAAALAREQAYERELWQIAQIEDALIEAYGATFPPEIEAQIEAWRKSIEQTRDAKPKEEFSHRTASLREVGLFRKGGKGAINRALEDAFSFETEGKPKDERDEGADAAKQTAQNTQALPEMKGLLEEIRDGGAAWQ